MKLVRWKLCMLAVHRKQSKPASDLPTCQSIFTVTSSNVMASHCFFIFLQLLLTAGLSHASERSVMEELLSTYDKSSRPTKDDLLSTNVTVFPDIKNLIAVIEKEETIKLLVYLRLAWRDDWLAWNPAEHNGTDAIHVPGQLIWQPDITILSSLETVPIIEAEKEIVEVDSDGTASISKPMIVSSYCPMRIANFPFDEQDCLLNISPWGYTAHQVTVYDSENSISMRGNSEWNAECMGVSENIVNVKQRKYKELHYMIHFKRNPSYYVWVLILPSYLITSLSIAGIFMPNSSSGERIEKVTLGLATLLTMAVILNIVSEAMPKGADLPMLGYFVMAEIVICMISLVISIVIIQIHHRVETRAHAPPEWISTVLFLPKIEQLIEKSRDVEQIAGSKTASDRKRSDYEKKSLKREMSRSAWARDHPPIQPPESDKSPIIPFGVSDDLRQLVIELRTYLERVNREEAIVGQWIRIFDRIDSVFLIVFQTVNAVASALILMLN